MPIRFQAAEEASAEDVEQADQSGENEATTTRIANLKKVLKQAHESGDQQGRAKDVPLLELLADPDDPVQTVENFFDLSFLVKVRFH